MSQLEIPAAPRNAILFWSGTLVFLFCFLWIFNDVLLPFVLGGAIAYLLDPLVNRMSKHRIPRWVSALIILGFFLTLVLSFLALILPLAYQETTSLIQAIPGYIEQIRELIAPYQEKLEAVFGKTESGDMQSTIEAHADKAVKVSSTMLQQLANGGQAIAGFISLLVMTPLVAFFMMIEWPIMTKWIDELLPRKHHETIKDLLSQINGKISGFVRGQISVAVVLGVIYAAALSIAGLNYGFIIGLTAGLLSVVPLFGSIIGLFVSIIVAWFQAGDIGYVAMIAAIFFTGQFVEGNFLTPRLLGKNVGMHPLWILFALMAGGSLLGIVGMLLAVPVGASIGVILSFALKQYRASRFYNEKAPQEKAKTEKKVKKKTPKKTVKKKTTKAKTKTS